MTTNGHGPIPNPERPNPGVLLTAEQVSERWQVPASHVYRLARTGAIPVVKLGRYRRFRLDALEAFERAAESESVATLDGDDDRGVRTAAGTARGGLRAAQ
jgi:excisionase family DNA binding protein